MQQKVELSLINSLIWTFELRNDTEQNTKNIHTAPDFNQQLQQCEWYFELAMISALFLIVEIHSTANLKNLWTSKLFYIT